MSLLDLFRLRPVIGVHRELRRLNDNLESIMHNHLHCPTGKEYKALIAEAEAEEKTTAAAQSGGILARMIAATPEREKTDLDLAIEQVRDMAKNGIPVDQGQEQAILRELEEQEAQLRLRPGEIPYED